jgi:hypothetical protein
MTNEFGKGGDTTSMETHQDDKPGLGIDMTADEVAALKKRDENAQPHISRLETENKQLRDELAKAAAKLDSATVLDDVMARLDNKDGQGVTPDQVADLVEKRIQQKTQTNREEANWNTVVTKLVAQHGSFEKADAAIIQKARELQMSVSEATRLAKQAPAAFERLFVNTAQSIPSQQTTTSATQQSAQSVAPAGAVDDLETKRKYYNDLRRKNPNKYWNVQTQMQYRRDMGFAD